MAQEIKVETDNIKRMHSFNDRWEILNTFDYEIFKIRCLETISNEINNECTKIEEMWGNPLESLNSMCSNISFILGIKNYPDGFSNFEAKSLYKYLNKLDLKNMNEYIKFIYFLEIILNIENDLIYNEQLALKIAEAFELSNANLKIIKDGNEYCIIYKGVEFLDKTLVIDNLKCIF